MCKISVRDIYRSFNEVISTRAELSEKFARITEIATKKQAMDRRRDVQVALGKALCNFEKGRDQQVGTRKEGVVVISDQNSRSELNILFMKKDTQKIVRSARRLANVQQMLVINCTTKEAGRPFRRIRFIE